MDVSRYRLQKAAALRCHVTQTVCTSGALRDLESAGALYEVFTVAYSIMPRDHVLQSDLFQPLKWAKGVR